MRRASRRSRRRQGGIFWAFSLMLAIWIGVGTPAASAQQNGDGEADIEAFRDHVARGAELRRQERYREALEQFEKAREVADHPKLMLATANLREAIGDCEGARDDMRQALEDGRGSEELRKKLVASLEENRQCVSRGLLVVVCEPEAAKVRIGQREVSCGEEVELSSGEHKLTAHAEGYRGLQERVRVEPGARRRHHVRLVKIAPKVEKKPRSSVPAWMSYGAYGSLGVGAALVVAGVVSDASAAGRQEEMVQAQDSGDWERSRRLIREGESAQTRTVVLYTSGAVLGAAGGLLWAFDEEVAAWLGAGDEASVRPQVRLGATEASVGAVLVW